MLPPRTVQTALGMMTRALKDSRNGFVLMLCIWPEHRSSESGAQAWCPATTCRDLRGDIIDRATVSRNGHNQDCFQNGLQVGQHVDEVGSQPDQGRREVALRLARPASCVSRRLPRTPRASGGGAIPLEGRRGKIRKENKQEGGEAGEREEGRGSQQAPVSER